MNIIVTGGAGFIGSNFVFHMLDKYPDYRIICLDKLTYAGNLSTLAPVMDNPNFRFVKADICDRDAVNQLFEEEHPDMVVNFAAESHVDRSIENPEIFLQTNIIGTDNVLTAAIEEGVEAVICLSTDKAAYPINAMGKSKLLIKEEGILAGIEVAKEVFRRFDPTMKVEVFIQDGTHVKPGDVAMVVEGKGSVTSSDRTLDAEYHATHEWHCYYDQ